MKILFINILLIFLIGDSLAAPEMNLYPDLSKAINGGKLIEKAENRLYVGCRYEYNEPVSFEDLKNDLKKFLGKAWTQKANNKETDQLLLRVMKAEGIDLEGHAEFTSQQFPKDRIIIMLKRENDGEKITFVVTLYGSWEAVN